MRWMRTLTAGVAVLSVALVGCTSTSESTPTGSSSSFTVGELAGTSGFAPQLFDGGSLIVVQALFAPLTMMTSPTDLSYVQAQSVTSSDKKVWTVTIKPGWTFSNGEAVTAQSYVDAWNYVAYGRNGSPQANLMSNVEGYALTNPATGEATAKTLSGLKVTSPTSFVVTLASADTDFAEKLAFPGYAAMPSVAYKDIEAYKASPIGNGAYEVASAKPGVSLTVKRYAGYKGSAPNADQINFQFFSSQDTAYTAVQAGTVDLISASSAKLTQVKSDFPSRHLVHDTPSLEYLGFWPSDPRLKNVLVRQAISMSIDRAAISKAIYGGLNSAAYGVTSTAFTGSPGNLCGANCTFDPAKAKQLLAQAGGWGGGSLAIGYVGGQGNDSFWTAIANGIRQTLGIPVTLNALPNYGAFLTYLKDNHNTGLFEGRDAVLYPVMGALLGDLFLPTGGNQLDTKYTNPAVTSLLNEGATSVTADDAQQKYIAAEKLAMADVAILPVVTYNLIYVWSDKITNVTTNPSIFVNLAAIQTK